MRYTDPTGHEGFEGVCTYCQDEEGSGAPDRGDGSSFHLSGVDSRALQAEVAAEAARQANTAKNGGVFNRVGNFFKWLIGFEETETSPKQPNAVSTPLPANPLSQSGGQEVPRVNANDLPTQERIAVQDTVDQIEGRSPPPAANTPKAKNWGTEFKNRAGDLPSQASGYYHEYTVLPANAGRNRGALRIVTGAQGEMYYTWTHYGDAGDPAFVRIR